MEHDDPITPLPQPPSVASVQDRDILSQLLTETDQTSFTKTLFELSQKYIKDVRNTALPEDFGKPKHQSTHRQSTIFETADQPITLPLGDVQSSSKLSKGSVNIVSQPSNNNRGKGSISFAQGPLSNDYERGRVHG